MIKNVLLILISFLGIPCFAQLKVINPTDKPVALAIGHYVDKGLIKGWSTTGWVKIAAKDSVSLLPAGIVGNTFYYYGQVAGCEQTYQGQYALFVHPSEAFKVGNAASDTPISLNKGIVKAPFIKVDLGAGTTTHRLVLTNINCSQNGKRQGSWTIYLDRDKEETAKPEDASFFRMINYKDGTPTGIVRDYFYPSRKLQWDGKLVSSFPDVKMGTCITYFENGKKAEEASYQNGQLVGSARRWDETGKEIIIRKTYRTINVLSPQTGYLVSYYNSGKSRAVIPVKLPANTVAWYYEFTASRKESEVAAAKGQFQLLAQLTQLVDETGISKLAMNRLTAPPGGNICNVYLVNDAKQSDLFEAKQAYEYNREGSRTSLTSAVVPITTVENKTIFLGLHNPDQMYGIHYAVEVVAIVEEIE